MKAGKRLNLLTLNCQRAYKETAIKKFLNQVLNIQENDFLLLQEVNNTMKKILNTEIKKNKNYQLIDNKMLKKDSLEELVFIYHKSHKLITAKSIAFRIKNEKEQSSHGMIAAIFDPNETRQINKRFLIISLHINAKFHILTRRYNLNKVKNEIKKIANEYNVDHVIIGGDFNSFLFEGRFIHNKILSPEYVCLSDYKGASWTSKFIEPEGIFKRIINLFGKIGISIPLKVDKFYVDKDLFDNYKTQMNKKNVRISDHTPIKLRISF